MGPWFYQVVERRPPGHPRAFRHTPGVATEASDKGESRENWVKTSVSVGIRVISVGRFRISTIEAMRTPLMTTLGWPPMMPTDKSESRRGRRIWLGLGLRLELGPGLGWDLSSGWSDQAQTRTPNPNPNPDPNPNLNPNPKPNPNPNPRPNPKPNLSTRTQNPKPRTLNPKP